MNVHKVLDLIDNFVWDEADIYGSAQSALFSCAEALHFVGDRSVPSEWEFSASPVRDGLSADDLLAQEIDHAANRQHVISWDDVRFAGAAMLGIVDRCKKEGRDY